MSLLHFKTHKINYDSFILHTVVSHDVDKYPRRRQHPQQRDNHKKTTAEKKHAQNEQKNCVRQ